MKQYLPYLYIFFETFLPIVGIVYLQWPLASIVFLFVFEAYLAFYAVGFFLPNDLTRQHIAGLAEQKKFLAKPMVTATRRHVVAFAFSLTTLLLLLFVWIEPDPWYNDLIRETVFQDISSPPHIESGSLGALLRFGADTWFALIFICYCYWALHLRRKSIAEKTPRQIDLIMQFVCYGILGPAIILSKQNAMYALEIFLPDNMILFFSGLRKDLYFAIPFIGLLLCKGLVDVLTHTLIYSKYTVDTEPLSFIKWLWHKKWKIGLCFGAFALVAVYCSHQAVNSFHNPPANTQEASTHVLKEKLNTGHSTLVYNLIGSSSDNKVVVLPSAAGTSSAYLQQPLQFMAEKAQLFFLDLPGHGYSEVGEIDYSVEVCVEALQQFYLKVISYDRRQKFTLFAHSLGANVALAYAQKYPQNIEKLILVSPATEIGSFRLFFELYLNSGDPGPHYLKNDWLQVALIKLYLSAVPHFQKVGYLQKLDYSSFYTFSTMMAKAPPFTLPEDLNTLIIFSDLEPYFVDTGLLAQKRNNITTVLLKNAGHLPFISEPKKFQNVINSNK